MAEKMVVVEQGQRFSETGIWHAQRDYYHEQGIDAWTGAVPFYITSNVYIAHVYAKLVLRFMQDWVAKNPKTATDPFYFLELGTGSGQFSFYFLREFVRMKKALGLEALSCCYIMSDFTTNNVNFWEQHEELMQFVEEGVLDFAVFDVERDNTITLLKSQKKLQAGSLRNPMTVIANYLFDSIVSDVFTVSEGQLFESLPIMKTEPSNVDNGKIRQWEKVKVSFEDRPITGSYYDDAQLDAVLFSYQDALESGSFMFPVGSLRVIRHLMQFSDNRMLLLTTDKGFVGLNELEDEDHPELDFHGSFSVMVNYDAIGRFFKTCGGDCFLQSPREAVVSAAFMMGERFNALTELQFALDCFVRGFSPADYFNLYELVGDKPKRCDLDAIVSTLCLSKWDPGLFVDVYERISDLIDGADIDVINFLHEGMHKVADNYYHLPECEDLLFAIGVIFQETGEYAEALRYFERSRRYFPSTKEVEFNSGLCAFELGRYEEAIVFYEQALEHDKKSKEVQHWLKKAKSAVASAA